MGISMAWRHATWGRMRGELLRLLTQRGIVYSAVKVVREYDAVGRLVSQEADHSGQKFEIQHEYDDSGNRTAMVYPSAKRVEFEYDPINRMTNVTDWAARETTYRYNGVGFVTNTVYPNGVLGETTWDSASRLTNIVYDLSGAPFVSRKLIYDPAGNLTNREVNAGILPVLSPKVRKLDQDVADRLTRTKDKILPDDKTWIEQNCAYDNSGNLLSDGSCVTMQYDYDNRLTESQSGGVTYQYEYDAGGSRVGRTVDGVARYHLLDRAASLPNVLLEVDDAGTPMRFYIWGANGLLAQVEADGTIHYFHADGQGTTLALSDETGAATDQWFISPYGQTMNRSGSTYTPYTYIGAHGVWSEGNSLYHMKARYYHAGLKRFLTKDPIGIMGGANLYLYANGNPIRFLDPLGLCSEESGGYWSRVRRHYGAELESHGAVLEWADTLGLWGLGAVGANVAAGAGQSLANYMAGEQIANSMLAGANTGGSMWARHAAAREGAKVAARTGAGRAALSAVGRVTLGVTVLNTSYSISARTIAGGRALIYGIWE